MANILQLDEFLSNKIAAGEVVERPASVVKELVENAIDANSSNVRIDIEEGGLSSIRILDDGDGIEEDDLETAFYRHATSKIKYDQDLFRIKTLGFRGEALPSIASVSKLSLKTSTGGREGHELYLEGGHIKHRKTVSPRKGTEITVTELFYNTPARLKYLKTIHTELGHISDVVNRMALSHPEISFVLTHNRKTMLQTTGNGDLPRVIASIYGSTIAKKMVKIETETMDFKVEGYLAKPEVTRSNRSYMSTVLNGRYVKNYPLLRAIQEGYHTLLPIGKFPLVVLHITLNPILIDVNVHPSKLEVRISKEHALQELITSTIRDVFKRIQLIPEGPAKMNFQSPREKSEQMAFSFDHTPQAAKNDEPYEIRETLIPQKQDEYHSYRETGNKDIHSSSDVLEPYTKPLDNTPTSSPNEPTPVEELNEDEPAGGVPILYPIGQLHGTYILAQNDEGLYMVDQHAAQERIKYEYFRDKLASTNKELQDLLVPLTFEFTLAEEELIKEHQEQLEAVGLFLEPFGTKTFVVRACPTWFPKGQEEETIEEMLEQLKKERVIKVGKIREEAAILMSCKAAIKANRHLTRDEMFQLLETLRTCEDPYTCPHGRPILIHYSTYEIERMFKRVMS
ncbi:DNA mismatch repair endonuclease MutL [Salipaludibacillus keqinensis]|uniref:DNA mismatch repair protein MutL n=1 Tax=Salipaludibacillus keqinensis TaxID=2045207 RepID=A0A323TCK7_9BACI|nr:DNA mismatch repair endonuclease MutL [Salipaludibacillus keqinensis]PYZ93062.1 DNA mismatch repair endonuclease MutL [Salipaludibacillus keqinensis]